MNKIFEHLLFCSMIIFFFFSLLTCEIEDSEKIDCAIDIASYTSKLEEICCQRGCCYKEQKSNSNIPWCYNKTISTTIPTTLITTILTTIPTTISTTIPTTLITTIPTTFMTTFPTTILTDILFMKQTVPETFIEQTYYNNIIGINYLNAICGIQKDEKNKTVINDCIEEIENQIISNNISSEVFDLVKEQKKDIIMPANNFVIQLTTSENQENLYYENISTIFLSGCEYALRKAYNISENEILLILKIDHYEDYLLTPNIVYKVFHPVTHELLNLSFCENTTISIHIPAKVDENNLIIYNLSSEYYTDKCYPATSDKSTDIILDDRVKIYVNNNLSLCEMNCEYQGYDANTKKAKCECNIKSTFDIFSDLRIDKELFWNRFKNIYKIINLEVLKCYYILFTKDGFFQNIGNFIIICVILIYIIAIAYFIIKGFNKFKTKIDNLVFKESEEIKKDNEKIKPNKEKEKTKKNNKDISTIKKIKDGIIIKDQQLLKRKKRHTIKYPPRRKSEIIISKRKTKKLSKLPKYFKDFTDKSLYEHEILDFKVVKLNEQIDIKNKNMNKKLYDDYEMNDLSYEEALKIDKRAFCSYYISLLKTKHIFIFSFLYDKDYNSTCLKICLFFFMFSLVLAINTLFFNDSTMHKIYEDQGKYNFLYQLPQTIYSAIITTGLTMIIKFLSLSEKNVVEIKRKKSKDNKNKNIEKLNFDKKKKNEFYQCLKIKFTLFYVISFILILLFWYYISCFCAVYKNTQIALIKDTLISFILSLIYPLFINLVPGMFRISSLKNDKSKCLYIFSKIIQLF